MKLFRLSIFSDENNFITSHRDRFRRRLVGIHSDDMRVANNKISLRNFGGTNPICDKQRYRARQKRFERKVHRPGFVQQESVSMRLVTRRAGLRHCC